MIASKIRPGVFPLLRARNLEGEPLTMPRELSGNLNLLVVAFQRWQQVQVDSWVSRLDWLAAERPGVQIYELPILSSVYTLARPFIDRGMASSIQDREVRQRTLTVYTEVPRVLRDLDLAGPDAIALFLVNREGQIFWRGLGGYDADQALGFRQTVAGFVGFVRE